MMKFRVRTLLLRYRASYLKIESAWRLGQEYLHKGVELLFFSLAL